MARNNPQSAEFWQGYRDGMFEIMQLGIMAYRAKYWYEFEGDNKTNHFKGMVKALSECERRLDSMNDRRCDG